MGLRLDDVCIDGSIHKAPCGGPGTGKSPVDRRKSGWKWSVAIDGSGIPIGWTADGANRNDTMLFDPTLDQIRQRGLHHDIDTLHPDRGYWGARVDESAATARITDLARPPQRKPSTDGLVEPEPAPLGLRRNVERTNSWLASYRGLARNTDRRPEHRAAQTALAVTLIITIKPIDHRDRWSPH